MGRRRFSCPMHKGGQVCLPQPEEREERREKRGERGERMRSSESSREAAASKTGGNAKVLDERRELSQTVAVGAGPIPAPPTNH